MRTVGAKLREPPTGRALFLVVGDVVDPSWTVFRFEL